MHEGGFVDKSLARPTLVFDRGGETPTLAAPTVRPSPWLAVSSTVRRPKQSGEGLSGPNGLGRAKGCPGGLHSGENNLEEPRRAHNVARTSRGPLPQEQVFAGQGFFVVPKT